jgi:glycosyltransferase involved in cell wall biosynthesis
VDDPSSDYILLIAGKGPIFNELNSKVVAHGLEKQVRFLGYIDDEDLVKYYAASDLVVVPSRSLEGFGLITIESLSVGTPVVGTPIGGTREILEHLDQRLLTNGVRPKDIARVIKHYFEWGPMDPKLCRAFSHQFGWEEVLGTRESLYCNLARDSETNG